MLTTMDKHGYDDEFCNGLPWFAFAGAAAALWAARYVIKIKTENQHMKAKPTEGASRYHEDSRHARDP